MKLQTVNKQLTIKGLNVNYQNDIRVFNRFLDGRPITPDIIQGFFDSRRHLAPSTIARNKAAIKKAMRLSMGAGANLAQIAQLDAFFTDIKPGKKDVSITDDKVLSKDELNRLIQVSGHKTGLIIRALFETAARVTELVNIKLENCKSTKDGIVITVHRKRGKVDTVYMDTELFKEIKKTYRGTIYLFENNGRPLSRFTIHNLIKHAGAHIERPDIHAHTLRHSWATAALPTLGLAKVSKYLSHSSPDTTAKYYLHGKAAAAEILAVNVLQFSI